MRSRSLLLALLLLGSPMLLSPAHGAYVEEDVCAEGACAYACVGDCGDAAFCLDLGACGRTSVCRADASCQSTQTCAADAGCAAADSCLRVADCVAAAACATGADCATIDACRAGVSCDELPCASSEAGCAIPLPRPVVPRLPGARACAGGVTSFAFRLDTGVTPGGASSLTTGSVDPVWRVSPAAPASGPAYVKGPDVAPGAWVQPLVARWINPYPGTVVGGPLSDFTYGAAFMIPAQAYSVVVSGRYLADNSAVVTLGSASYASPIDAFGAWNSVTWTGVPTGVNAVTADVHNRPSSLGSPTPTGFAAELLVRGLCKPGGPGVGPTACTNGATSFRFLVNTGIDALGNVLPPHAADPHWVLAGYPPADYAPPTLSGAAFTHAPYPGWVASTAASWINHDPATQWGPAGDYLYRLDFVVPANAYDVHLVGRFAADNEGILSDTDATTSWFLGTTGTPMGFASWTSFHHVLAMNGPHSLTAKVNNHGGPTGLIVEAEVYGKCRVVVDTGGVLDASAIVALD